MKRMVAVLVAVALMIPVLACAGWVEKGESVLDECEKTMKELLDLYDSNPTGFDEDYTYCLYAYYNMYYSAHRVFMVGFMMDDKEQKGGLKFSTFNEVYEQTKIEEKQKVDELFQKWMNGDARDDD